MSAETENALGTRLSIGDGSKEFGQVTPGEAEEQGAKLKGLAGFGPTMRVRPVGMAWSELAKLMKEKDAATVSELDEATVGEFAKRLWVVQPGGSMMQDPKGPVEPSDEASS
ncbi:MAG: hypothetical protein M3O25_10870 [Actinomycetota bacterium]|nr:hypothetical protein [Actinomycetota bacterium]